MTQVKRKRKSVEKQPTEHKQPVISKPLYTVMLFGRAEDIPTVRAAEIVNQWLYECDQTPYTFNVMNIPEEKKDIAGRFMVQFYPWIVLQKNGEILGSINGKEQPNNILEKMATIHNRAISLYK